MAAVNVKELLKVAPKFADLRQSPHGVCELKPAVATSLNIPRKRIRYDYDQEVDALYLSFGEPRPADDGELTDDDLIIRYDRGEIIGITILNASYQVR